MIHHLDGKTVCITDSGMYEPEWAPYRSLRRRRAFWRCFRAVLVLVVIGCGLWGASHT